MSEILIKVVINGLLMGGIYALISLGLTLIFGVVRIVNFAHGEFLMLSMYASYWLFQLWGIDPYVSVLIIAPLFFVFGMIVQRGIFQPILNAPEVSKIFAAIGLVMVLQNLALLFWKGDYRAIKTISSGLLIGPEGFMIGLPRFIAFLAAVSIMLGLYFFIKNTYTGKAIRATGQDQGAALLMGINTKRIFLIAFGIGSSCVGIAGCLLMPIYSVFPTVGAYFVLVAFVIVVLGGLGSMLGAFIGGLIIGLVEALSGYFISSTYKEAIYFIIFWFLLIYKPTGLFGSVSQE
ncbi:MAG: branched-chain amino acid ABC transporter permease [Smithellaceae bacterium]|jgi:branched-chain amino acid transport system permease protein